MRRHTATIVKAAFVAVLGVLSVASQDGWNGVKLLVNQGDGLEPTALEDPGLDGMELEVANADAAAIGPARLFEVAALATADLATLDALSDRAVEASGLDGMARDRCPEQANQRPGRVRLPRQMRGVLLHALSLCRGQALIPADGGVIVVSAGIGKAVTDEVMRGM